MNESLFGNDINDVDNGGLKGGQAETTETSASNGSKPLSFCYPIHLSTSQTKELASYKLMLLDTPNNYVAFQ